MDLSSTSIKKETKTKKERERDETPEAGGPPWDRVRLRSPGPTRRGPCLPGCGPWEERPPAHPAPSPPRPSLSWAGCPHRPAAPSEALPAQGLPAVDSPAPVTPRGLDDTRFRPSVTGSGCGHSSPWGPHPPALLLTSGPLKFLKFCKPLAETADI